MKSFAILAAASLFCACAADAPPPVDASTPSPASNTAPNRAPSTTPSAGRSAQNPDSEARPVGDKNNRAAADLAERVEYYDGADKRSLWLSSDLVAELAPSEPGRAAVLARDAQAVERPQSSRGVRVWRVRAQDGVDALARTLTREQMKFAPVVHESASSAAPMLALPGGAVATFPAGWERARIDTWLAARGLRVESTVVAEANMHLVATPPGLESVRIANELYESGELVACTPNLWREARTR